LFLSTYSHLSFLIYCCLFLFVSSYLLLSIYSNLSVIIYPYLFLSTSVSTYLFVALLSIDPSIYLSTYLSIYRTNLSIYLTIYLSIYPSIYLTIYLSIHPSILTYICTDARAHVYGHVSLCVHTMKFISFFYGIAHVVGHNTKRSNKTIQDPSQGWHRLSQQMALQ